MAAQVEATAAEDGSGCHLLELSHDGLGVIVDGLADPLQPVVAVALSSTCKGLRTPLRPSLAVLKVQYEGAKALCGQRYTSGGLHRLYDEKRLSWAGRIFTSDGMVSLNMILRTRGLPVLQHLDLYNSGDRLASYSGGDGDASITALCDGLGRGVLPSLQILDLTNITLGTTGAQALAAALRRGAMPMLETLSFNANPLGDEGAAALAPPLRKLSALKELLLTSCKVGDAGVAALFGDLGEDEFKALEVLRLVRNEMTDAGCATLVAAMGGMPRLSLLRVEHNLASEAAERAVQQRLHHDFEQLALHSTLM